MTDFKTSDRDVGRAIRSWLREDRHEDASRIAGAVLDQVEATQYRRAGWPARGTPTMNRFMTFGLGAAAVVVIGLLLGARLLGSPTNLGGPNEPTATPSEAASSVEPSSSGDGSLPVGRHLMDTTYNANEDFVIVTIPAPGWFASPDRGSVTKDLGGDDRVTVVAGPQDYYRVPRNICNWQTDPISDPDADRGADTVDELVAYLAEQTYGTPEGSRTREFSTPVEITIGGYPGQSITSVAPVDPNSDLNGCDEQRFCNLLDRDGGGCLRSHLEPGALDTIWIVDMGEWHHVVAASYWPTTGSALLAEMNAIVDSMTFADDPQVP
jgi:hypothetical protein